MNIDIHTRLAALRTELEAGQKMMADLKARRKQLRQTLTRIEGAIMVLEELAQQPSGTQATAENGVGAGENG